MTHKPVPFNNEKEYKVNMRCRNCGYFFTFIRPKGIEVTTCEKCPNCRCQTARKSRELEYSLNFTDPIHLYL